MILANPEAGSAATEAGIFFIVEVLVISDGRAWNLPTGSGPRIAAAASG